MKVAVVGAGLAGATAAVLLREAGHWVEVFETRTHLGGNCYDEWDRGVLVHRYGPHGFHTSNEQVWSFLNRFTRFHPVALRVEGHTSRGIIPLPFNDVSAGIVGDLSPEEIRDLVFRDYSEKHWGIPWEEVPRSISTRLPERRRSEDCRYHLDPWQGVPAEGYTRMFEAMLDGLPLHLGCMADAWRKHRWDHVIFTGSIDDYFGTRHGRLEYRSLEFRYEEEAKRRHFQLNECNRVNRWTRSVDHSHWLDQELERTVVGYEFPCEWEPGRVRMYPKPFGDNPERYRRYREMAEAEMDVTFVGRLATYKYLDMDDVVAQVMTKIPLFRDSKREGEATPAIS
jgi:UDP-galactopyranose mutase